jgi:uncharacterized membrane protein YbaN (DUF454 family)
MEANKGPLNAVFDLIIFLSVGILGVFLGSMLTEGYILLPFWQSISAAAFYDWCATNGERMGNFYNPLNFAVTVLPVAAAIVSLWQGRRGRWFAVLAAACLLVILAMYYAYFKSVNEGFIARSYSPDELAAVLVRWGVWHCWRTVLSVVALAAGLASLYRR